MLLKFQDVVFDCARPVLNFLRILGVFPFTRNAPGEAKFKILSTSMAYSMVVFIFLIVSRYQILKWIYYELIFDYFMPIDICGIHCHESDKHSSIIRGSL